MKKTCFWIAVLSLAVPLTAFSADDLASRFREAPPEFSPVPIWWWSGDPIEKERIRFQLEQMAAGGIHNAMILNLAPSGPLYGSAADEPPFLSEEWWDLFGYALQVGKEVGVRLWFYDQLGFSGSGLQARVVRDHPEFRGIDLRRTERTVTGPTDVELQVPTGGTALAAFSAIPDENNFAFPHWIWDQDSVTLECKRYFRRTFDLDTVPPEAELHITCNDNYIAYINGVRVGGDVEELGGDIHTAEHYAVGKHLRPGKNVLAVIGENLGGMAFLVLELVFQNENTSGSPTGERAPRIVSDTQFRISAQAPEGWTQPDFDDSSWDQASSVDDIVGPQWGTISGVEMQIDTQIHDVRNLTGKISDGKLSVSVPEGRHSIQLYYTLPGGFDYQNPDAGAALIDIVHGEMERRFGPELGKSIAGSFQDEFPMLPRFSERFPEEFRKQKGYDILECLPALYDNVTDQFGNPDGPTTIQIRCDANDIAAELCEKAFFIPLHEWHEKYGLLCGYDQTVRNGDPVRGDSFYIDYFKTMRHFSAPGNDMDGDCKAHQSMADLYKRPRVWAEVFHSSGWGQTVEEINTLLNPWLVNGGTLFNPHAIYYSIHGSYWEWAPPDTGWRQPYFKHYKVFADYISRLTSVLSQGTHVVEVGVLRPSNTVHGFSGFGKGSPPAHEANRLYWEAQHVFRDNGIDYIIVDEDSIRRGVVEKDTLRIGDIRFRVVVLPGTTVLYGETLALLTQFAEQGGTVIIMGEAPKYPGDHSVSAERFDALCQTLHSKAVLPKKTIEILRNTRMVIPAYTVDFRDFGLGYIKEETLSALKRTVENRDFYFILSDNETKQNGAERFNINKRNLWETEASQGKRRTIKFASNGVPEMWDSLSGEVRPFYNYTRVLRETTVEVDLSNTPAPLISFRPPTSDDPHEIKSGLDMVSWEWSADKKEIVVRGFPRPDAPPQVRMKIRQQTFEGTAENQPQQNIPIPGPLNCTLKPTCDNKYGCFAWPPSDGPIPVEIRSTRFHSETEGADTSAWKSPDFDDSGWETVIASFGPRAEWTGPLKLAAGETFETVAAPPQDTGTFKPSVYSLKLGINEDPVFYSALGGKGRIPEDFIDLGPVLADDVYLVRATVNIDAPEAFDATLRTGGDALRRAFLNGKEVPFQGIQEARKSHGPVRLQPGPNRLEILASRKTNGTMRLFYQFLPLQGIPDDPEWIWSPKSGSTGISLFTKTIQIPGEIKSGEMIVALGDLHKIRVNGRLVADQGNFDPYFTSRAERYDIKQFLQQGENRLEIEARDVGQTTGLLLDGLVVLADGREIQFVSDNSFQVSSDKGQAAKPARILNSPSTSYMGDPALMLLRPRPHPLPQGGWLADQPPLPEPFSRLTYSTGTEAPKPGWYRFLLPPGAVSLALKTPGKAELYVNGNPAVLEKQGDAYLAQLADPMNPRRMAALRIQSMPGYEEGAALLDPITIEVGTGRIPFGSWDQLGLPHYSGGMVYSAEVDLPDEESARFVVDLGRVRGTAEAMVNGKSCGVRLWHPYRFDISSAVRPGKNVVEILVYNTLGPHFAIGHPSGHVYENHTVSGIFGPMSIHVSKLVEIRLKEI